MRQRITKKQAIELSQMVGEHFDIGSIAKWAVRVFGKAMCINTYKTCKGDEVVQLYDDHYCLDFIGGSSGDLKEWLGNLNAFNFRNLFKRKKSPLYKGLIHWGFLNGAVGVLENPKRVRRKEIEQWGYSRGAAIAQVCNYLTGSFGGAIGTPKAFWKWVNIDSINIINKYDPVGKVVPTFATVGKVYLMNFFRRPHTGYIDNIED